MDLHGADSGNRWEFGIQVPFGLFVAIVGVMVIPSHHLHQKHHGAEVTLWKRFEDFDWAGSVFLVRRILRHFSEGTDCF